MRKIIFLLALSCVMFYFGGCRAPTPVTPPKLNYSRPLPEGQDALRKITNPDDIPDFTLACIDLSELRSTITNSINYMNKPSSKQFYPISGITHAQALESLKEFAKMLDSGLKGSKLNEAIKQKFDVYISVGCDDKGTVLFTGYYTPIFDASATQTARFKYPLYKTPSDLVKGTNGEILGRKGADGKITQYPSRAEIEKSGMLKGTELYWLSDPFEVYVAHVQGSARLKLPSGEQVTIGYDASNGHEYNSIQKEMVKDGKIPADKISLATMIDYFKQHPNEVDMYMQRNPRFVFFTKIKSNPLGCLNEPVTAMRSIATDKSIFPRASLSFISTVLPAESSGTISNRVYRGFALDQDAGGAIRAPGRCDVYMGIGPTAGKLAGQTYQEGKLYYLFLKSK
jgi:membrane-bound lytic murein transglycosylase A